MPEPREELAQIDEALSFDGGRSTAEFDARLKKRRVELVAQIDATDRALSTRYVDSLKIPAEQREASINSYIDVRRQSQGMPTVAEQQAATQGQNPNWQGGGAIARGIGHGLGEIADAMNPGAALRMAGINSTMGLDGDPVEKRRLEGIRQANLGGFTRYTEGAGHMLPAVGAMMIPGGIAPAAAALTTTVAVPTAANTMKELVQANPNMTPDQAVKALIPSGIDAAVQTGLMLGGGRLAHAMGPRAALAPVVRPGSQLPTRLAQQGGVSGASARIAQDAAAQSGAFAGVGAVGTMAHAGITGQDVTPGQVFEGAIQAGLGALPFAGPRIFMEARAPLIARQSAIPAQNELAARRNSPFRSQILNERDALNTNQRAALDANRDQIAAEGFQSESDAIRSAEIPAQRALGIGLGPRKLPEVKAVEDARAAELQAADKFRADEVSDQRDAQASQDMVKRAGERAAAEHQVLETQKAEAAKLQATIEAETARQFEADRTAKQRAEQASQRMTQRADEQAARDLRAEQDQKIAADRQAEQDLVSPAQREVDRLSSFRDNTKTLLDRLDNAIAEREQTRQILTSPDFIKYSDAEKQVYIKRHAASTVEVEKLARPEPGVRGLIHPEQRYRALTLQAENRRVKVADHLAATEQRVRDAQAQLAAVRESIKPPVKPPVKPPAPASSPTSASKQPAPKAPDAPVQPPAPSVSPAPSAPAAAPTGGGGSTGGDVPVPPVPVRSPDVGVRPGDAGGTGSARSAGPRRERDGSDDGTAETPDGVDRLDQSHLAEAKDKNDARREQHLKELEDKAADGTIAPEDVEPMRDRINRDHERKNLELEHQFAKENTAAARADVAAAKVGPADIKATDAERKADHDTRMQTVDRTIDRAKEGKATAEELVEATQTATKAVVQAEAEHALERTKFERMADDKPLTYEEKKLAQIRIEEAKARKTEAQARVGQLKRFTAEAKSETAANAQAEVVASNKMKLGPVADRLRQAIAMFHDTATAAKSVVTVREDGSGIDIRVPGMGKTFTLKLVTAKDLAPKNEAQRLNFATSIFNMRDFAESWAKHSTDPVPSSPKDLANHLGFDAYVRKENVTGVALTFADKGLIFVDHARLGKLAAEGGDNATRKLAEEINHAIVRNIESVSPKDYQILADAAKATGKSGDVEGIWRMYEDWSQNRGQFDQAKVDVLNRNNDKLQRAQGIMGGIRSMGRAIADLYTRMVHGKIAADAKKAADAKEDAPEKFELPKYVPIFEGIYKGTERASGATKPGGDYAVTKGDLSRAEWKKQLHREAKALGVRKVAHRAERSTAEEMEAGYGKDVMVAYDPITDTIHMHPNAKASDLVGLDVVSKPIPAVESASTGRPAPVAVEQIRGLLQKLRMLMDCLS